ncbi:MAG: CoB--CoM heterodisulfide reductase iron-sulfur subunit B family protein [Pseudomonadota bacterium]|uniref:CoB--CoM heterodisulfide reductase iron-sulfur subunit B family protein n=1 Tax=Candidatus Desulfatibia profunda TaxID=2841695 RepID=A0A8J6NQV9_9BACT|nr:CoB--CoM heterodisulfide reductase iron-sulfur subunit B family protein [Candidatus Desulfatibia profunda]MBL7178885.1 CoB--CoM heterodisulfide reductase iron-sulfur subunit B family protein [Desulfobacterales bacterium]MBU0699590.1 CoB--CoM heterodisulfide reductase iron-sulfur subunit B family protein [Pseudomonadota bacterium]
MKFALYIGCNIPARLKQYESSARAVLRKFDVGVTDIREFNCCGYPVRNMDHTAFVLASARNLALAARENLSVISLCKCCFGSLKKADHLIKENAALRAEINRILEKEGLKYDGDIEVKHFLSVLFHDIGIKTLKEKIEKPFSDLKIATHYGCHVLRPSKIVQFDDPVVPSIFDQLVEVTGARSIDWPMKLECCGAPVWGINDDLSMRLTEKKLADGDKAGADYLCTACPFCQMQFDTVQQMMRSGRSTDLQLPSVLYPQLLGLSLGIDRDLLGLEMNRLSLQGIEDFVRVPEAVET